MKKFVLAALAAMTMISAPAMAKDPCPGVKEKKDSFGTARLFEAGDMKIRKVGDSWTFTINMSAGGGYGGFVATQNEVIAAGSMLEVKLADGTVTSMPIAASVSATVVYVMGVTAAYYPIPVVPSPEQITLLSTQNVVAMRVLRGGVDPAQSGEAKKGDAEKFRAALACMASS